MRYVILALVLPVIMMGCASPIRAPIRPPVAWLYTNYRAPLETNYSGTTFGEKKGIASERFLQIPFTYGILSFSWGDSSVNAAAKEGRIERVNTADYEFTSVLGIYSQMTSIVYGE